MTQTPTREKLYHWVDLDNDKESVRQEFVVTYRGRTFYAQVSSDRYKHTSGWSEWRSYVERAWETPTSVTIPEPYVGIEASDAIRSSLTDILKPHAEEWLTSDDYPASWQRAARREILGDIANLNSAYKASRVRRTLLDSDIENRDDLFDLIEDYCDWIEKVDAAKAKVNA